MVLNDKGMTLVEVLVAAVILSIAVIGVATVTPMTVKQIQNSSDYTEATNLAQQQLDMMKGAWKFSRTNYNSNLNPNPAAPQNTAYGIAAADNGVPSSTLHPGQLFLSPSNRYVYSVQIWNPDNYVAGQLPLAEFHKRIRVTFYYSNAGIAAINPNRSFPLVSLMTDVAQP